MLFFGFFSIQRITPYKDTSTAIIRCDYNDYLNHFTYLCPCFSRHRYLSNSSAVKKKKMSRVHFRLNMGVYIYSNHSYLITPETNTHPVAPSQKSLHWPSYNKAVCHKTIWSLWRLVYTIFSHFLTCFFFQINPKLYLTDLGVPMPRGSWVSLKISFL